VAQHRIGELRIDVRAPARDAPEDGEVRGYVGRVWEAVGDALERRHPGRVYRVRSWEATWQLTRAALRRAPDAALVDALVAQIAAMAPAPVAERPAESADVACFGGEGERVAAWWCGRAAGRPAHWAWADLDAGPSVAAVLAALAPEEQALAVQSVQAAPRSDAALALLPAAVRAAALAGADGSRTAAAAQQPALPAATPEPVPAELPPEPGRPEARSSPGTATPPVTVHANRIAEPAAPERADAGAGAPVPPAVEGDVAAAASPQRPATPRPEPTPAADHTARATAWGGLVHLVGPMLECGVGEALWQACLDERAVVHRALRALCGDDPVAAALSGVAPGGARSTNPASRRAVAADDGPLASSAQLDDVRARLAAGLRRAVPRRGLATLPPLADAGDGAARVPGFPWAVPGPAGAPAAADPVWAPDAEHAVDAALLALVVGVPATLLGLRAGWPGGDADAFAARWLRRPARIDEQGEVLVLRFGAEQLDLALRRTGADADPGWVPWLGRTVRLVYDVAEPD
jgi:hypothetical protein